MVDLPEGTIFRNALEERRVDIALKLQADGRMRWGQSYDYSVPGQLTVTAFDTEGGKSFTMVVLLSKSSKGFVDQELTKAVADFDKVI